MLHINSVSTIWGASIFVNVHHKQIKALIIHPTNPQTLLLEIDLFPVNNWIQNSLNFILYFLQKYKFNLIITNFILIFACWNNVYKNVVLIEINNKKMNKLIESLIGLFKWSGESSWLGIIKSMVVVAFLGLICIIGYLGYIEILPWTWILLALFAIIIFGVFFIIILSKENDESKFDRWYRKMKQNEIDEEISNRDRRMETMPIIQEQLRALSYINGPDSTGHAAVYEFHNGHSNPAGLGFQFAEMTAEEFGVVQHTAIQDSHQKLPLGVLQIPHLLRNASENLWCGDKEALKSTDPKLYMIVSNYVCEWLAIKLIKTSTEIGMLCYFSQKELSDLEIERTIEGINEATLIIGQRLDYRDYKK